MIRYLFIVVVAAALLLAPAGGVAKASSVPEARIAQAVRIRCVGDVTEERPGCQNKLHVRLEVTGEVLGTVVLDGFTTMLGGAPGLGNATITFKNPLEIRIAASPIVQEYPLRYERLYPAFLSEESIAGGEMDQTCQTGRNACGPYVGVDGRTVNSSEGLCCDCSVCLASGDPLCGPRLRDKCLGTARIVNTCLRPSELQYSGYSVGKRTMSYSLGLWLRGWALSMPDETPGVDIALHGPQFLSATVAAVRDADGAVSPVTLAVTGARDDTVGVDMSGDVLFMPSDPPGNERALAGAAEWMVLPGWLVAAKGTQCDRVGFSQEGFESRHGAQCAADVGSCHHNELETLRAVDLGAPARGETPKYLLPFKGNFSLTRSGEKLVGRVPRLSVLELELVLMGDTSDLDIAGLAPSPGCVSAERVEGANGGETVEVTVKNTGTVASWYYVRVGNCTSGVVVSPLTASPVLPSAVNAADLPPGPMAPAGAVLLLPPAGWEVTVVFGVELPVPLPSGELTCDVSLCDATSAISATTRVAWNTPPPPMPTPAPTLEAAICSQCAWYDLKCYALGPCLVGTTAWFVGVESILVAVYTTYSHLLLRMERRTWAQRHMH